MKLSELILRLQATMREWGDIEVFPASTDGIVYPSEVKIRVTPLAAGVGAVLCHSNWELKKWEGR
jgi:hypothetical protein